MTLNVAASTPSMPNLSAPPVMPAGKSGDAAIGSGGFGDMLDKLAQAAAGTPGDATTADAASANGCADEDVDGDGALPSGLTMPGLMFDWSAAMPTLAAGSSSTPKAAKRTTGDESQAVAQQTVATTEESSDAAGMLLAAIAMPQAQPVVTVTPTVAGKDVAGKDTGADADQVADALSGKAGQGDPTANGSTVAHRVAAKFAGQQAGAAQENALAETHVGGDDKRGAPATETPTQAADAADLAAKLAAAAVSTPTPARVSVDPKAVQRAEARQAAAKAIAPASTPVALGDGTATSMLTAVAAPGASTSDARQHAGERSAAGHTLAPSIAAQAHASTFEGAIRATNMDSLAARTNVTGAGALSAASDRAFVDNGVPQQIVQAIRMQWNQGVGTARVTLQPDYLGNLTINIKVDNGGVTAVLDASNATVRQWLEGHEPMLRQALADQGLTLDRFVVNEDQPSSPDTGDAASQGQQEQPRRRRQREAPTDQSFEVLM